MQLDAVIFVKKGYKLNIQSGFLFGPRTLVSHDFAPLALIWLKTFPLHYYAEQLSPCRSLQTVLDVFAEMEKKGLLSNTKLNDLHAALTEVDQRVATTVKDFMQRVRGIHEHVLTVITIIHVSIMFEWEQSSGCTIFSSSPGARDNIPPCCEHGLRGKYGDTCLCQRYHSLPSRRVTSCVFFFQQPSAGCSSSACTRDPA